MKFKNWLIAILILSSQTLFGQLQYVNNDSSSFLKLMFVGDLTLNQQLLDASFNKSKNQYDFQYLFHYIRPVLNLGDIVIGNIDHTFGKQGSFLLEGFNNIPDEYGVALKYAGFNLLMNANRSAVFQELDDWKANKAFLDKLNINQIGSFENEKDRYKRNPTIIEKHGIKIAFLNYIAGVPFYPELTPLVNGVDDETIKRDILLAKNRGADFTIVYMNWGSESQTSPNPNQVYLAKLCLEEGANMVLGTHPKAVQSSKVEDGLINGFFTKILVAYSLGDFISSSDSPLENCGVILEVILEKNKTSNVTFVNDIGFIPTFSGMYDNNGRAQCTILPVSQVEKNNVTVPIGATEKQWMSGAAEKVRHNFSAEMKEVEYDLDDEIIDDVAEVLTVTRRPLNENKDFALEVNNHLLLALGGFSDEEIASKPIVYKGFSYKVQFLSLRREMPIDVVYYKHLAGYETYYEDEYFHYVIGYFSNLKQANDFCLDVKRNGHKYAYVVAFENGVKKN
jgi:poly-gamma-glutamate capsule biosynthesis protein CapA/YwtB (metallophosphatase superfamily)